MAGGTAADPAAALLAWAEALADAAPDPVSEMLALVWGPSILRIADNAACRVFC